MINFGAHPFERNEVERSRVHAEVFAGENVVRTIKIFFVYNKGFSVREKKASLCLRRLLFASEKPVSFVLRKK